MQLFCTYVITASLSFAPARGLYFLDIKQRAQEVFLSLHSVFKQEYLSNKIITVTVANRQASTQLVFQLCLLFLFSQEPSALSTLCSRQ